MQPALPTAPVIDWEEMTKAAPAVAMSTTGIARRATSTLIAPAVVAVAPIFVLGSVDAACVVKIAATLIAGRKAMMTATPGAEDRQ